MTIPPQIAFLPRKCAYPRSNQEAGGWGLGTRLTLCIEHVVNEQLTTASPIDHWELRKIYRIGCTSQGGANGMQTVVGDVLRYTTDAEGTEGGQQKVEICSKK